MAQDNSIDQAALDELFESVGSDKEFMDEIIEEFFQDTPGQLAIIQDSLSSGDAEALRRAAHSLKSNSASFGATHLHDLCMQLENMGKIGELDGAAGLLAEIEVEYQLVQQALDSYQKES
jgi:HPt (histidine-containing phosphotransfer) domain-containing protein